MMSEGGFEAGSITEIYGEGRSGKSQICHMLCVMCQVTASQLHASQMCRSFADRQSLCKCSTLHSWEVQKARQCILTLREPCALSAYVKLLTGWHILHMVAWHACLCTAELSIMKVLRVLWLQIWADAGDSARECCLCKSTQCCYHLSLLHDAAGMMCDSRYGLLVVDSATALYRTEYNGRGELSERQNHLGKFLNRLQQLAEEFNVAVVIANQVKPLVL